MKLLFVCTGNKDRSPTAEAVYKRDRRFAVRSCGTKADAKVRVSQELLDWADHVIVMMPMHKSAILRRFRISQRKISVLKIRDIYNRMDPVLVNLVQERTEKILAQQCARYRGAPLLATY